MNRLRGTGLPNLSRDINFSGAKRDMEKQYWSIFDREQDWQSYPVDPYPGISHDHTYIHSSTCELFSGGSTSLMSRINGTAHTQHTRVEYTYVIASV